MCSAIAKRNLSAGVSRRAYRAKNGTRRRKRHRPIDSRRTRLDPKRQVSGRGSEKGLSSYQTLIAIASARRVVAFPATISHPLSRRDLNATLVLRTVTRVFASQLLTCLSTAIRCVPVKVLTLMACLPMVLGHQHTHSGD